MYKQRKSTQELMALKGVRQIKMLYITNQNEAQAADQAGIDMLSIEGKYWSDEMRQAAGSCFVQVGLPYGKLRTEDEYLRAAHEAMQGGGDCVYCAASNQIITRLADEGIPVVGHAGLIPSKIWWTGYHAVGKTADSAMRVFQQVKDLEIAGAIGAELEVVPDRVAAEISKRTQLLMLSMGAGPGADAQYLFAEDILGHTRGHRPRHAKVYRDFQAEFSRLQDERIAAFKEFIEDVDQGIYPGSEHIVPVEDVELEKFMSMLQKYD